MKKEERDILIYLVQKEIDRKHAQYEQTNKCFKEIEEEEKQYNLKPDTERKNRIKAKQQERIDNIFKLQDILKKLDNSIIVKKEI